MSRAVRDRRADLVGPAVLAVVLYPPLLVTKRGEVAADSKQLLFVNAGRFLGKVPYLWDPSVGMGTVTHQTLGYLLPMGPWFWVTARLGVPVWLSQRLWLATILFAGGLGVLFLARTLRWSGAGPVVAALGFALTPYVIEYATHLSVLLLPFAGLPWLVALAIRAVRDGGWRAPAGFAIVVALVGSVNATALVCVLLGPAVVLVVEVVSHPAARRRVLAAAVRLGVLSVAVSIWWMVALAIESRYGLDLLRFTESLPTVTLASSAPEVLRGLGYWFFYGRDALGPYLQAAPPYQTGAQLALAFLPVILAVAAALVIRWRRRALFVAVLVVGTVVAVGAHPYGDSSPYGALFKYVVQNLAAARALRSITRVTPLVALAVAVLLGAGVTAVLARSRRLGQAAVAAAVVAVLLANLPLWRGQVVSSTRVRPEAIPGYWVDAARTLDHRGGNTRVLELPGIDFAAYQWGYAGDSITPGLMDRPTVAREVVPYGTAGTVDLVTALDRRLQDGVFDPVALPTIARLISAGDVLVRNDLQYQRYGAPSPQSVAQQLSPPAPGVGSAVGFGGGSPASLAILPITGATPIEAAAPAAAPVIVDGSGEGLVDAAEAGVLPSDRLVVYAGSLAGQPAQRHRLLADHAELVVTDSNRRRALRAKSIHDNYGYTERAGETPLRADPDDARLNLFPGTGDASRTLSVVRGPTARATSYGNEVTLVPSDRPELAVDGDPSTAWRVGDFAKVIGEQLEITAAAPVTADHLTLLQAPGGNRTITRVELRFDGGAAVDADLGPASRAAPGQTVSFPRRRFRRVTITILDADPGPRASYAGLDGVGFAEVTIPGVAPADQLVRPPVDLLRAVGTASAQHPLTYVLSRLRTANGGADPIRSRSEEPTLARLVQAPTTRAFTLSGTVRPAAGAGAPTPGCRRDLLTLDGSPLPVQVGTAAAGGATTVGIPLATCSGTPVTLTAGTHALRSADGRAVGLDTDQVVLRSAAGGGAAPPGAPASAPAAPTPKVTVVDHGPTQATVRVRGAREPFWLVLGQSHNPGWHAAIGGRDLGPPMLVDGYANAWYVRPGTSSFTVSLRWTPQRFVWIGLAVSGLALALCLVLALRRRRPTPGAEVETDDAPTLALPVDDPSPTSIPSRVVVVLGAAATVVGVLVTGVAGGLVVGAATVAALRLRRGRSLLAVVAFGALAGSFAYIAIREHTERFRADFAWPASFDAVHAVALVGLLVLAVDVVADWATRRFAARARAESER